MKCKMYIINHFVGSQLSKRPMPSKKPLKIRAVVTHALSEDIQIEDEVCVHFNEVAANIFSTSVKREV
jgi:hypothetical protein